MMRSNATCRLLAGVLVLAIALSEQTPAQATTKSAATFKQLASLVGNWEGVQDGVPVKVTYTLTADRSAVMEQMTPGDSAALSMITMFTADGDHLVATHYCAAGNQPQMVSGVPGDLQKGVTFSLVRVTGMKTPDDWHNTGLTVTLDDNDHMTQRWTYLYKGKAGTNVFHYVRKK
jgi:hypothetical protein